MHAKCQGGMNIYDQNICSIVTGAPGVWSTVIFLISSCAWHIPNEIHDHTWSGVWNILRPRAFAKCCKSTTHAKPSKTQLIKEPEGTRMMPILNNPNFLAGLRYIPVHCSMFRHQTGYVPKKGVIFNSPWGSMRIHEAYPSLVWCIAQEATPTFELENWCQNQKLQHSRSSPQVCLRVPCWIPVGLDDVENSMPKNCFGYNCFLCRYIELRARRCPSWLARGARYIYIYSLNRDGEHKPSFVQSESHLYIWVVDWMRINCFCVVLSGYTYYCIYKHVCVCSLGHKKKNNTYIYIEIEIDNDYVIFGCRFGYKICLNA